MPDAGLGMKMGEVANGSGRVVQATLSGSSAETAGLHIGDIIMSVDGVPAAQIRPDQLRKYLRGPVGSAVEVVVYHPDHVRRGCYWASMQPLLDCQPFVGHFG
jgi:C-terminal processing protease CtpA/Prc